MHKTFLSFDMRAPSFGAPSAELYDAALEMCAFGDEVGIDGVIFPEHHGSEDGYNPKPALMAAAVAARTKRMENFGRVGAASARPCGSGGDYCCL